MLKSIPQCGRGKNSANALSIRAISIGNSAILSPIHWNSITSNGSPPKFAPFAVLIHASSLATTRSRTVNVVAAISAASGNSALIAFDPALNGTKYSLPVPSRHRDQGRRTIVNDGTKVLPCQVGKHGPMARRVEAARFLWVWTRQNTCWHLKNYYFFPGQVYVFLVETVISTNCKPGHGPKFLSPPGGTQARPGSKFF